MGGTSSETTQNTDQASTVQLPPWINTAAQQNYGFAQGIAARPLQQYAGQQVANIGPQTQQAWNLAANSGNTGQPQYDASTAGYLGVLGQGAPQYNAAQGALANPVTAATGGKAAQATASDTLAAAQANTNQLASTNLAPYMNPYTQSVINKTLPIMQQANALNQNQIQNQANSANAFGGSRLGIQQGVAQAQGAQNIGQMAAQLNAANFAQAVASGQFDVNQANQMGQFNAGQANQVGMFNEGQANQVGMFNAGQYNQMAQFGAGQQNQVGLANMGAANNMAQFNAGALNTAASQNQAAALQNMNLQNAAATGLDTLGNDANRNVLQNYSMLSDAGQQQQGNAQAQIDANMNQFNQAWNYPTQQLGILQSALGMTPYGNTQTTQGHSDTTTQTSPDYAQTALGLLSVGANMFKSDKRIKKNIQRIGTHAESGLPTYSFRFKGQSKGAPKTMGPIAQDVEKKYPAAVANVGGVKHVAPAALPGGGGMLGGPTIPSKPRLGLLAPSSKLLRVKKIAGR